MIKNEKQNVRCILIPESNMVYHFNGVMYLVKSKFHEGNGHSNRPDFQKLLDDIDMGYISTIIVKDMSRLGRDYLQVGYYTDNYFPDTEQSDLKKQILALRERLSELDGMKTSKDNFIKAVRRFMEMQTLTPAMPHELIDKIEVHHITGTGKSKVQQIVIHYRFVGCVEIPDAPQVKHTLDTRQGVSVTYQAIAV